MIMVFSSSSKICLQRYRLALLWSQSHIFMKQNYREYIIMYDSCRYFSSSNTTNKSSCHCVNQRLLLNSIVIENWLSVSSCLLRHSVGKTWILEELRRLNSINETLHKEQTYKLQSSKFDILNNEFVNHDVLIHLEWKNSLVSDGKSLMLASSSQHSVLGVSTFYCSKLL